MKLVVLTIIVCAVCLLGCERSIANNENEPPRTPDAQPTPKPTKPPIPAELLNLSSSQLCDRLADIKVIPTFEPTPTDPIYEALVAKGDDAIPCLIDNITDKREVPDPRYSVPIWQHYAVGDTAVFILIEIVDPDPNSEALYKEMIPPTYRKEWETNGMYAYFNYVSTARNRKELQRWWKSWIKQNMK